MKKKKAKKKKDKVAKNLRKWLNSPEGKKAWEEANERAREFAKKIEKCFRLTPEQLQRRLYWV